jgi:hypothetical protein
VATEPGTSIGFFRDQGLEVDSVIIDPDEPYAIYAEAADIVVVSDKPILAAAYMTNALHTSLGSPSMVQLAPVDQWTRHEWVWVPEGYETHLLVEAAAGTQIEIEAMSGLGEDPPPQSPSVLLESVELAGPELEAMEIHRFTVAPGIHEIQTSQPAQVVVGGWRTEDGFAYLGGWGPSLADLEPVG